MPNFLALAVSPGTLTPGSARGQGQANRDNRALDSTFQQSLEKWLDNPLGTRDLTPIAAPSIATSNTANLPPGPHSYPSAAPLGSVPLREELGQLNLTKALPRKRQRR